MGKEASALSCGVKVEKSRSSTRHSGDGNSGSSQKTKSTPPEMIHLTCVQKRSPFPLTSTRLGFRVWLHRIPIDPLLVRKDLIRFGTTCLPGQQRSIRSQKARDRELLNPFLKLQDFKDQIIERKNL